MPKSSKTKYYAVKVGPDGPSIYNSWEECKTKVSYYPGAIHKSFATREGAEEWLNSLLPNTASEVIPSPKSPTPSPPPSSRNPTPPPVASASSHTTEEPTFSNEGGDDGFIPFEWESSVKLSDEQTAVLNRVKDGKNVFFTGSAGTGKSVLLREIICVLGGPRSRTLGITASTGIAAINIGGTTLHSWAGIGLGQEPIDKLSRKLLYQKKLFEVRNRWRTVDTLIIDEISMIDGRLFDKLEALARILRNVNEPFGGIQLVLSGDFCQLPPVSGKDDKGQDVDAIFAFDAESWNACIESPMTLTNVFRQKDKVFIDVLNSLRLGKVDSRTENFFRSLSRSVTYNDGIEPTELFSTRAEVDDANQSRLQALPGETHTYVSRDYAGHDSKGLPVTEEQRERLLNRLIAPKRITLKVGAQIMLIKNLVQGTLVNGSLGIVMRFASTAEVKEDLRRDLELKGKSKYTRMDDYRKAVEGLQNGRVWPVVRFTNKHEMTIIPRQFTVENADGGMEACREQVPLILAYALSVHKSQGQTLERVKVDLKRTFEKGQAYVALSRATSLETLQVLNFDASKVTAHPRVLSWYGQSKTYDDDYDDYYDDTDNEEAMLAYSTP